jgi:enoyl-CoA hydratase/carnithine racemase
VSPVLRTIADGVGRITLNRPDRMNAVTVDLARELELAILELGNDPAVNVLLIRGAGGNFCAGGDFSEVDRLRSNGAAELRTLFEAFRRACDAIGAVEPPVVAAVEGVAMAGGFELMQAADVVLVTDDARIADNHINHGMIPGGGSSARLPRLVGRQAALGLLLSGDRLSGIDAVHAGLAYRSFPSAEFDEQVRRFVARLASRERSAVVAIKRLVNEGMQCALSTGLDGEIDAVVDHIIQRGTAAAVRTGAQQ